MPGLQGFARGRCVDGVVCATFAGARGTLRGICGGSRVLREVRARFADFARGSRGVRATLRGFARAPAQVRALRKLGMMKNID